MSKLLKFVLCYLLLMPVAIHAQDIIVKKDGNRIKSKVIEITSNEVFYKDWDNQLGEMYAIEIDELLRVEFQNGEKEIFSEDKAEKAAEERRQKQVRDSLRLVQEEMERKRRLETMESPVVLSTVNQSPTSLKDEWHGGVWSLNYIASGDYADKGSIGVNSDGFMLGESNFGYSWGFMGMYSLATKKWFDSFASYLGPNIAFPITKELLLYVPVCVTMSSEGSGSDSKIVWGASATPSIGIKLGNAFISAGWYMYHNFKSSQSNTDCFFVTLGIFSKD